MEKLILVLAVLLTQTKVYAQQKQLEGVDGCFILYDLKNDKQLVRYGDKRCAERVPACSTFKVPLALMSFDRGVLKDENELLKWNGVKREILTHNQDHTAATWMRDSVVWYSQALTPKLGRGTIEKYLKDFGYGTYDMSGGLDVAWLTEVPSKTTLKVSADEQVKFMASLFKNKLPVSKHAADTTKKIIFLEKSANGFELSGKTGSGSSVTGPGEKVRVGWFVSHVKRGEEEFIAVTSFTDTRKDPQYKYGGPFAKEITKSVLIEKGYWSK